MPTIDNSSEQARIASEMTLEAALLVRLRDLDVQEKKIREERAELLQRIESSQRRRYRLNVDLENERLHTTQRNSEEAP